ncbi:hypothetical protein CI109_100193 [Kwoniella shandongensis]|uniref:Uncharacterized protein n=1 Tax=Kwoniella shandongensis TaxID=1734106 RepID=A0A5M6BY20_9TREE|nr:uncharacterized protein CI109_005792 [Kwoniella shandongensis]KAA5525909.1 hypothetical protein CI109_005792 [Kwoniella shandongensis]
MSNYSFYAIPAIFLQTLLASNRGAVVRYGVKNNVSPRTTLDYMEKSGKFDKKVTDMLRRRQAAHENCTENQPIMFAAIIAGNAMGLPASFMNKVSIGYFVLRWLYIWAYIKFDTRGKSFIRSIIYWGCNFCFLATFVKCGLKLNESVLKL